MFGNDSVARRLSALQKQIDVLQEEIELLQEVAQKAGEAIAEINTRLAEHAGFFQKLIQLQGTQATLVETATGDTLLAMATAVGLGKYLEAAAVAEPGAAGAIRRALTRELADLLGASNVLSMVERWDDETRDSVPLSPSGQ